MKKPTHIYNFNDIPVYVTAKVDETNVNIRKVLDRMNNLIPSIMYQGSLTSIYIGRFEFLSVKGTDGGYNAGVIYMSSDYLNKDDEQADLRLMKLLAHELGHVFEQEFYDDIYQGKDFSRIELEFQDKKTRLFDILDELGYSDYDSEWIYDDKPNKEFENWLENTVGYENIAQPTEDEIVDSYAYTCFSEYLVANFQYYFIGNKSRVLEYSPEVYNFFELILDRI